jgi:hypothetical protein
MKAHLALFLFTLLFISPFAVSQENENALLLKIILTKYYKEEKVIAKGRLQLLSFYCKKAPNNQEVLEVISKSDWLKKNADEIKNQIDITANEDWSKEYNLVFDNQNQYLKKKVNACLSFEEYKIVSDRFGENNQRLMIVSKPIYFANATFCLVKVAFYRSIEHNSGSFIMFEKVNGIWIIKEYLNEWAT